MSFTIIFNDLKKNFFINFLLLIFVITSSLLFSSALGIISKMSGSVKSLMEKAGTPDFMQMHSGNIDYERLDNFTMKNDIVEFSQVSKILNIDGQNIIIKNKNLSDSVMDNGFCIQNKLFDFLLDSNGEIIKPNENEIYVPLSYWKKYSLLKDDVVKICNVDFIVKDFLRDSQMNSDMASSKRFLISECDYEKIKDFGNEEYLIEFKTYNDNDAGKIENAYIQTGLENNGPAISYSLFYLINILSEGVMIAVIILMSLLIVLISFLCIRFTLLATLEDDYYKIGIMKAIGFYQKEISNMYIKKYSVISLLGCFIGFVFSFIFKSLLIKQTDFYISGGVNSFSSIILSLFGVAILYFWIMLYVRSVLKKIKKISASKAIREGRNTEIQNCTKSISLSKSNMLLNIFGVNIFLGIQDVLKRKRIYVSMMLVLVLSVFIMIVPQNIYQTIKDSSFLSYMGLSKCNVRIDLQQLQNLSLKSQEVENWIKQDKNVEFYNKYATYSFQIKNNNSVKNIKIEKGDYSNNTIDYINGHEPKSKNQIALSYLESLELSKNVGDKLELYNFNKTNISETTTVEVCGIYSDVTNGGKTAKMISAPEDEQNEKLMWYVFCIQYKENVEAKIKEYQSNFGYGKIVQIDDYICQTVGSIIDSLRLVSKIAIFLAIAISVTITSLFINLLISKDSYSIYILYSIGFSNNEISVQYVSRAVFVLVISIVLGTIAANTLGVLIAGSALSNIGIANLHFVIKPLVVYFMLPFILMLFVIATSFLCARKSKNYNYIGEKI